MPDNSKKHFYSVINPPVRFFATPLSLTRRHSLQKLFKMGAQVNHDAAFGNLTKPVPVLPDKNQLDRQMRDVLLNYWRT